MSIHSQEGTITGNNVERGVGKSLICMMVNDHRMQIQKPSITQSAVYGLISKMKPKKKSIDKRPQGSYDILSRICRARYLWGLQTSIHSKVKGSVQWVKDYCKAYNEKHNLQITSKMKGHRKGMLTELLVPCPSNTTNLYPVVR